LDLDTVASDECSILPSIGIPFIQCYHIHQLSQVASCIISQLFNKIV
jgi:hypothetical protein